jgi:lipopolysaccharide biosynthesis protein
MKCGQEHSGDVTAAAAGRNCLGDVCLFAQYDRSGRIPAHTRRYLAHLADCGLRVHVACAGVAVLAPEDAGFLEAIGATGRGRVNLGLDFGAWCDLLDAGCASRARRVLFANDSVFGPYGDLRPILERMNASRLDAWGLVESHERVWHLQSWFVCLSAAALARPAVQRVFAQDFAAMSKEEVILHGELGLGVALRTEQLAVGAVWRDTARLRRLMPVNPSHFDWLGMLESGAVPFLKTELLRLNPANIGWIGGWRDAVRRSGGDPGEIDAALGAPPGTHWDPPRIGAKPIRTALNVLLTHDHRAALRSLLR